MPVDTLGLSSLEKLFFPLMRYWWFVNSANYLGLSRVIGLKCWNNCRNSSLLGEITVNKADKHSFVQAGGAMQVIWLEATRQGLTFQPLAGLAFLIYRLNKGALDEFSENHRQKVQRAAETLTTLFGISDKETMVMGFRIGKGKKLNVRTARKPI